MYTRKKQFKKKNKQKQKKNNTRRGGAEQFKNFQNVGKTMDDFFSLFNIDELSKKNSEDYLGYKTYNRNNIYKFLLIPSTTRENQFSGIKMIKDVQNDDGINLIDSITYDIQNVDDGLGEFFLNTFDARQKPKRKGVFKKEIKVKETLKDNIPAVSESNIASFVDKRFNHL